MGLGAIRDAAAQISREASGVHGTRTPALLSQGDSSGPTLLIFIPAGDAAAGMALAEGGRQEMPPQDAVPGGRPSSYQVGSRLDGLLQPVELPRHQENPSGPYGTGLVQPVLLRVARRLLRRGLGLVTFVPPGLFGRLLALCPLVTAVAALQPTKHAPRAGAQRALLGRLGGTLRPCRLAAGTAAALRPSGRPLGRGGWDGVLARPLRPCLLLQPRLLLGQTVLGVVGPAEVPQVLVVGGVAAQAADQASGAQRL